MATTKFEVGAYYITMNDAFNGGEQTGKSVVIERTEGTVTFKHLASGEIFVREVQVFDAVQVEGCEDYSYLADNFGEEITTAEVEPTAEIEPVENTAEVEPAESAVETTDSTAEIDKPTVEVCKAYDAKEIIAACYSVEVEEIDNATEDTAEIKEVNYIIECTRQDILSYKKEIIYSESIIARDEKLIQLYTEENKIRSEDKSLKWLIELNQDEIESHESNISDYTRRIKREEARLADLEEKLAALKKCKVAA